MTRCLIVDGYNIINSWPELKAIEQDDLDGARNKLIELLENYRAYKGISAVLVFDAHLVKGNMEKQEYHGGLQVVYTKENETADGYIERLVHQVGKTHDILVATSDWLEQQVVLGRGAARISSRELYHELKMCQKNIGSKYELRRSVEKHTIENRVNKDVLDKLDKIRRQR